VRSESLRQFLLDRDSGRFAAWILGWEAQSADPDNFWFWHFGAGRNAAEGQYDNPELALSLLSAQRTIGAAQRAELYRAAAQRVHADQARIFLAHTRPLVAVSARVRGYEPEPFGFDNLAGVSLQPAAPGTAPPPAPTGALPTPAPEAGTATPAGDAAAAGETPTADPGATPEARGAPIRVPTTTRGDPA
jgi:hypothetical protein